ncbi:MAG: response regulator [Planctomycetota bacterium]
MTTRERILVVDDEADTQAMLQALLEAEGYAVETAADGAKALEHVQAARPDLILLDIMMPQMDGLEVCDRLRFDPETRDVPIIFLTARQDPAVKSRASILDAYAYIEKPFDPDALLAEVRNCLNVFGREARDDDREQPSA